MGRVENMQQVVFERVKDTLSNMTIHCFTLEIHNVELVRQIEEIGTVNANLAVKNREQMDVIESLRSEIEKRDLAKKSVKTK